MIKLNVKLKTGDLRTQLAEQLIVYVDNKLPLPTLPAEGEVAKIMEERSMLYDTLYDKLSEALENGEVVLLGLVGEDKTSIVAGLI